jgi:hypothetical protein
MQFKPLPLLNTGKIFGIIITLFFAIHLQCFFYEFNRDTVVYNLFVEGFVFAYLGLCVSGSSKL